MPDKKPPKISAKVDAFRSPWMSVSEKTVDFGDGRPAENYYSVRVPDYVVIFAVTESGLIPIIRQYRPAVEQFTYEFPAGTIDKGETAEQACRRELLEETGLIAGDLAEFKTYFLPGDDCTYELTVFWAVAVSGVLLAADDAASAGLFTRSEIALLPLSSSMLEAVDEILAAGNSFARHSS